MPIRAGTVLNQLDQHLGSGLPDLCHRGLDSGQGRLKQIEHIRRADGHNRQVIRVSSGREGGSDAMHPA